MADNGTGGGKKQHHKVKGLNFFKVRIGGADYWRISVPQVDGKRWSRTFKDRRAAESFYSAQCALLKNAGRNGFGLSNRQREDATHALELLEFSARGVTLADCVRFYLESHKSVTESRTVSEAVNALIKAKEADGWSHRYILDLRSRLLRFARDFEDRSLASITGTEIASWLRGLEQSPVSRNTFHQRLVLLFTCALEQGWVSSNPVSHSMTAKTVPSEPGILSPDQFARLLSSASPEMLPYWTIGGFAGLRRAELERLEWSQIDFESRLIEVTPKASKTASRRHVEILPALAAWLSPYRASSGRVCPANLHRRMHVDMKRAAIDRWPSNALRHSFASYHLEAFQNAGKTTLQLGHVNATMIFKHYRQRVKPAAAAVWWNILPLSSGENIIELAAG